ncbi:MAG: hypothetical protein KF746_10215 [Chitinophagaceae bacterium]|nr:hypothetical protein [Chitinophagaceae bacterium]
MKRLHSTTIYLSILLMGMLTTSCEREFDHDADFTLNEPAKVFGDNTLLFTKIFQFENGGAYLWFDIRNEIANFSSPFLGHTFQLNGVDRYKRIDLRGRLYEYNENKGELTILNYPLDIATGEDLPADIVYSFGRKQKEGCELIADAGQRGRCERAFTLQLERVVFKDIGLTLEVNTESNYNGRTLTMYTMSEDLLLKN